MSKYFSHIGLPRSAVCTSTVYFGPLPCIVDKYGFLLGIQSNITHVDTLCLKRFSVYCINFNEKIQ